jgi:hypothetical protein
MNPLSDFSVGALDPELQPRLAALVVAAASGWLPSSLKARTSVAPGWLEDKERGWVLPVVMSIVRRQRWLMFLGAC